MKWEKSKVLTTTITPDNATDKSITWKSSDENIATVSAIGEIIAKKTGTIDITASSSNGKTSTIKINIKEKQKVENNTTVKASTTRTNNTITNNTANSSKDSNPLGGILTIGLLGGGGYWGYKKYKNSRK